DAGAFERDVDAEFLPRKLGRILDRRHLERIGTDVDRVALDPNLMRETPMHRIIAQEMGIGFNRSEIVDCNDVDVLAARLVDRPNYIASDPPEPVDSNTHLHPRLHRGPVWFGVLIA